MLYTHFLSKKSNHQSLSGQAKMDNLSKIENIPPQRSEKDSVTKNLLFMPNTAVTEARTMRRLLYTLRWISQNFQWPVVSLMTSLQLPNSSERKMGKDLPLASKDLPLASKDLPLASKVLPLVSEELPSKIIKTFSTKSYVLKR